MKEVTTTTFIVPTNPIKNPNYNANTCTCNKKEK